ncbi:HAD domain-containing protein [Spirillospora sp. CA-128828]|uniref:HAD domain-containing protein n=1 Tax=Spirillospora sp. CA-128828 TaxID=3240033 RepID=UPI003D8B27A2
MRIDFDIPFSQSTETPAQQLTAWARARERLHHLDHRHPEQVAQATQDANHLAGELCADLVSAGAIPDDSPAYRCPDPECRQTPVLLLDVDGVLNPKLDTETAAATGYTRHTFTLPAPHRRELSPWLNLQHGDWLRGLALDGLELVWCTGWEHAAADHIAPVLGLRQMFVLEVGRFDAAVFEGRSAKAEAVTSWLADRPAVWLDDVHGPVDHQWARDRTADGIPTLLVTVVPTQGFAEQHLTMIKNWLAANDLTTLA